MATADTCFITICFCYVILTATTGIATCWTAPRSRLYFPMCASSKADIISVSKQEAGPKAKTMAIQFVRFKSMSPRTIYLWELGNDEQLTSDSIPIAVFTEGTNLVATGDVGGTYVYSTEPRIRHDEAILGKFNIIDGQELYLLTDNENNPPSKLSIDLLEKETKFSASYKRKTGRNWNQYFNENGPRPPPIYPIRPALQVGEKYAVVSEETFWNINEDGRLKQSKEPITLTLECVSTAPRIFVIKNFLSDYEAEKLINIAKPSMEESVVGTKGSGGSTKSKFRTSSTTWISHNTNSITSTIVRRVSDILGLPTGSLVEGDNAEPLQVVNYKAGQQFNYHYDWFVSPSMESRFSTLLLYLTDKEDEHAGGDTAFYFPSTHPSHDPSIVTSADNGIGLKIHPGKGSAVLFYNLLEDGNGDILSMHAGSPVLKGEKWLANIWLWDPKLPTGNSWRAT